MISTLNINAFEKPKCEDSFFVKENEFFVFGGVFDGCSTGKKSYWASQTLAYLFQLHGGFDDKDVHNVIRDFKILLTLCGLDCYSGLSTCLLFWYDKQTFTLKVRCFGDGVYWVNDKRIVVEQDNSPDYIAYHLDDLDNFLVEYEIIYYKDVTSFKICSDGVLAIVESQFEQDKPSLDKLFVDRPTSPNYLTRMWNILKKHYRLKDDLTMITYDKTD